MNWEEYRRDDNSIDLVKAFLDEQVCYLHPKEASYPKEIAFLKSVEDYCPIKSRQVAAVALAQASFMEGEEH